MKKIDQVYRTLCEIENEKNAGVTALEICAFLKDDRSNVSRLLNQLYKKQAVTKYGSRPVYYNSTAFYAMQQNDLADFMSFDELFGSDGSLKEAIQKAKVALKYPPYGLHTLLLGRRGTGKIKFAEAMYHFLRAQGIFDGDSRFQVIDCSEYRDRIDALLNELKPTYQVQTRVVRKQDRLIYLKEVEELEDAEQSTVLNAISDKAILASNQVRTLVVLGVYALDTSPYLRHFPHAIELPKLADWSMLERYRLVETILQREATRLKQALYIEKKAMACFLLYEPEGNATQMETDLQWTVAKAYLNGVKEGLDYVLVRFSDLAKHLAIGIFNEEVYKNTLDAVLAAKSPIITIGVGAGSVAFENHFLEQVFEAEVSGGSDNASVNAALLEALEETLQVYGATPVRDDSSMTEVLQSVLEAVSDSGEFAKWCQGERRNRFVETLKQLLYRRRKGIDIVYPKTAYVLLNLTEAVSRAQALGRLLNTVADWTLSDDELALLAVLFVSEPNEVLEASEKVNVLIVCHGVGIGTGMSAYVNAAFGKTIAVGLDLGENEPFKRAYTQIKEQITVLDEGMGVLLLVDMGRLTQLGPLLNEETRCRVETVSKVSLPMALKAGQMALEGYKLQTVAEACKSV
ncbi:PTS sugar transporter subunit IIA domain-containing protein [Fusibacter sp. JL298sf-3]